MRGTPLAGIGVHLGICLKVAAAEGLQRMAPGALLQQIAFSLPTGGKIFSQLRHQHRRRLFTVVAHMVTSPADIERAPR